MLIRLKNDFWGSSDVTNVMRKNADTIIPGLLNGNTLHAIAGELQVTKGSVNVISSRVRDALGIEGNNPFSLVDVAFQKGLEIRGEEEEFDRIKALDEDETCIIQNSASGKSVNDCIVLSAAANNVDRAYLRQQAFLKAAGDGLNWKCGKTLLPATLLRAVEVLEARKKEDFSLFPNTDVSIVSPTDSSLG